MSCELKGVGQLEFAAVLILSGLRCENTPPAVRGRRNSQGLDKRARLSEAAYLQRYRDIGSANAIAVANANDAFQIRFAHAVEGFRDFGQTLVRAVIGQERIDDRSHKSSSEAMLRRSGPTQQ